MERLPVNALGWAHTVVDCVLQHGDTAVDATVGNGHDTLFLAERVGPEGQVYGLDIHPQALASATTRLDEAGVLARCTLLEASHADLAQHLPKDCRGEIRAVMFNLGYLPGDTKRASITCTESTLPALQASFAWLAPGGVITVVCYLTHPGGLEEAEAVATWAASLPQEEAAVFMLRYLNQRNAPPELITIQKRC